MADKNVITNDHTLTKNNKINTHLVLSLKEKEVTMRAYE